MTTDTTIDDPIDISTDHVPFVPPARPPATVTVSGSVPSTATAVGYLVGTDGEIPKAIGLSRRALAANGFDGEVNQTFVVAVNAGPTVVAVGAGDPARLTPDDARNTAAAFARITARHASLALVVGGAVAKSRLAPVAQALVEGVLLGRYRPGMLKTASDPVNPCLESLTLVGQASAGLTKGAERGAVTAEAAALARDLANLPPGYLTAASFADRAIAVAAGAGLDIEVFDGDALRGLGCGGILGVNQGSTEPPRMIKLTYTPKNPAGHLALVGKGITYDSGGLSLKPTNPMSVVMKMDMSGAGAVLATMSALKALKVRNRVTGYLMCTDNMPSGSAMKLGDVLTIRNGTTVEIHNTDAEGRLVLADGLALAVEDKPDAVVDIATLTGAVLVALGTEMAGVLGNDERLVGQVEESAARVDEQVWELPLATRYRKLLDSHVADMKNVGGPNAGTIIAAVFLSEFVGDTAWAHLDIAGPMSVDGDEAWRSKGATGFGTRLLIDLVSTFRP